MRPAILAILLTLGAATAPPALAAGVDLSYGMGNVTGREALERNKGHVLLFMAPAGKWYLNGVSVCAQRHGEAGAGDLAFVLLLDQSSKPVAETSVPYRRFPTEAGWVRLNFPPTEVSAAFGVCIITQSTSEKGVSVGWEAADKSFSQIAAPTQPPVALKPSANWLIRAHLSSEPEPSGPPDEQPNPFILPPAPGGGPQVPLTITPSENTEIIYLRAPSAGLVPYRAPNRRIHWVKAAPPLKKGLGRLVISWDGGPASVSINYVGKPAKRMDLDSTGITIDLPVAQPGDFEAAVSRPGFAEAKKEFHVVAGKVQKWVVKLVPVTGP